MFAANRLHRYRILLFRCRMLSLIGRRAAGSSVVNQAAKLVATVRFLLSGRSPCSSTSEPYGLDGVGRLALIDCHALGYELAASTVFANYCLSILDGAVSFIPGGLGRQKPLSCCLRRLQALGGRMPSQHRSLVGISRCGSRLTLAL